MRLAVLALRNLARHRRRTLLSLLVIAAGTVALVLTAGFVRFSFEGLREGIITGGLGHLEVRPREEDGVPPPDPGTPGWRFREWESVREAVERRPHVVAAAATIHLSGLVSAGESTAAFLGAAVEPARERRMGFVTKLRAGDDLADAPPAEGEETILLGESLARSLAAGVGEVVTLVAMTEDGTLNALDVTVAGLVTTGIQDLDSRYARVHLETARRLVQTEAITALVVGLDATDRTEAVAEDLRRALDVRELRVADWRSRAPFYAQVEGMYVGIFTFLGAIVFVLVCLSSTTTMLMSVLERVREIGTLRAVGTSRPQVALLVLFEAAWLGLFGAAAGNVLGLAAGRLINALHVQMPPPPGATSGIDLQLAASADDVGATVALMLAVVSLAAVVPALNAVRLRIVDALAHA